MLQLGTFDSPRGSGEILAWSIGTETGYSIHAPLDPRLSVLANVISGDTSSRNANLQTYT